MGELTCCPACAAQGIEVFFQLEKVPVHQNLLMRTREAAQQCPRGDIALGVCPACEFISNLAFEPRLPTYSPQYENSRSFSPVFHAYVEALAADLVRRHGLYNKDVIEIGCGKGEFLTMLCRLGHNRGVGFDPSYVGEEGEPTDDITFIGDFYSERYSNYQADLICGRHVLEHIQYPGELLASLRRSIGDRLGAVVFFEVPSAGWILHNVTFWDIFYEHCSYFTPGALVRLCASAGFNVVRVTEAFGDQYLWLEALPDGDVRRSEAVASDNPQEMAESIARFTTQHQERVGRLRRVIHQARRGGKRCVVWGAGAKGVTFVNSLDIQPEFMPYVVDVNSRKQDTYIPGTGQQIVSPDVLKTYKPDIIFVMNPYYFDEIREAIASKGISSEIISV